MMTEQTIPLAALAAGMARCVREWILPHLTDPLARLQAEHLAALLDSLPRAFGAQAAAEIRLDTEEGRALLQEFCASLPPPPAAETIAALMDENTAVKKEVERLAAHWRQSEEAEARARLRRLQQFIVRSLARELRGVESKSSDFATLTSRESAARKDEKKE